MIFAGPGKKCPSFVQFRVSWWHSKCIVLITLKTLVFPVQGSTHIFVTWNDILERIIICNVSKWFKCRIFYDDKRKQWSNSIWNSFSKFWPTEMGKYQIIYNRIWNDEHDDKEKKTSTQTLVYTMSLFSGNSIEWTREQEMTHFKCFK